MRLDQVVQGAENQASLQMKVAQEGQDIDAWKRHYAEQVEDMSYGMQEAEEKRGKRGFWGTLLGIGASFTPIGALGGAIIGGLASGLLRNTVEPYTGTIVNTLPGGEFWAEARKDEASAISSTQRFIDTAADGQSLLNWTNAFSDAATVYQFGKEVPSMKEGFRDWAVGSPTGGKLDKSTGDLITDAIAYEGGKKGLFKGRLGKRMKETQLKGYKKELQNELLRKALLGEV